MTVFLLCSIRNGVQLTKKNRKNLKMSHTTGTTTFAQIRHEYVSMKLIIWFCYLTLILFSDCESEFFQVEKHGVQPDQVTFFVMTHTRGKGDNKQPVDEASREMMVSYICFV